MSGNMDIKIRLLNKMDQKKTSLGKLEKNIFTEQKWKTVYQNM